MSFPKTFPARRPFRSPLVAILLLVTLCLNLGAQVQPVVPEEATNAIPPIVVGEALEFSDGSILHGKLRGMDRATGLKWEHPDALQPLQFRPDQLQQVRFHQHASSNAVPLPCRFRFRNGDDLFGELLKLDETAAQVNTRFGTNLRVDRSALAAITFLSKHFNLLYEGPTGLQGWSTGKGGQPWKYREGAFITEHVGSIGRDVALPAASNIEFDVAWEGQLGLIVQAYTENIDRFDYSSASYMLYINANSVGIQRVSPETGISNLGNAQLPDSARKNSFHLELRASREEATLAIYIDGILLQKWKDNSGFAAKGPGVLFFSQHEGPRLKLGNIRVSEWDGKFEDSNRAEPTLTKDRLLLVNRDRVEGKIVGLKDGKLKIAAPDTSLDIPLARLTEINFANAEATREKHSPWFVRALLTGGEKLSFELDQWTAEKVSGTNGSFGRMEFSPANIRSLQFNFLQPSAPRVAASTTNAPNGLTESVSDQISGMNDHNDIILLRNGDSLAGVLQTVEPKQSLRLKRPDTLQAIEFKSSAVAEVRLKKTEKHGTNDCQVTFINGNQLEGALAEITPEKIVLNTWFAGKLELPRDTVQMLVPLQADRAPLYSGPDSIQGWVMGNVTAVNDAGEWSYQNGAFYATKASSIARDMKLPDVGSIQFDIAWKGTLQMAVALYTSRMQPINLANKDAEVDFGGFYSLQLGSMSAGLLMVKKDAPINYLWQLSTPLLSQKNQAHIEIRADKAKRTLALLIDGVVVKQAVDADGFAGTGTALRFVHQGLGTLRLSNLKVAEWDGLFEEPYSNKGGTEDLIRLRNGDRVHGKVEKLTNGKLSIATDSAKLEVPWQRVKQLEAPGKGLQAVKEEPFNALGQLTSGAPLKFEFVRWDEKGIHVENAQFGKAIFDPAVFQRVRFNFKE